MSAAQQIKLAEALASAGRIQEATVYFNALLESQQGSGLINLQLARLAARQGNVSQAIEDYQRAIYGNWEGDGYVRRRDVRFELINYLIAHQLLDQARSELLVASGNAPEDDISVQLDIARTMEQAQDPSDALHLYKTILRRHPSLREALEGAGRTAFQLGRYLEAKQYLARALEGPGVDQEPTSGYRAKSRSAERSNPAAAALSVFAVKPAVSGAPAFLTDRKLAMARLAAVYARQGLGAGKDSAAASASRRRSPSRPAPIRCKAWHLVSRAIPAAPAPNQAGCPTSGRPSASSDGTMAAIARQNHAGRP